MEDISQGSYVIIINTGEEGEWDEEGSMNQSNVGIEPIVSINALIESARAVGK